MGTTGKLHSRAIGLAHRANPHVGNRLYRSRDARAGRINRRLIAAIVAPGMVAVDIGAHGSVIASRLMQLFGKAGQVYALEPVTVPH